MGVEPGRGRGRRWCQLACCRDAPTHAAPARPAPAPARSLNRSWEVPQESASWSAGRGWLLGCTGRPSGLRVRPCPATPGAARRGKEHLITCSPARGRSSGFGRWRAHALLLGSPARPPVLSRRPSRIVQPRYSAGAMAVRSRMANSWVVGCRSSGLAARRVHLGARALSAVIGVMGAGNLAGV